MANSVTLTFSYNGSDFTRKYKFEDVDSEALATVKDKILELNDQIAANEDDDFHDFFICDDYDATDSENVVGDMKAITAAQYDTVTTTIINLN